MKKKQNDVNILRKKAEEKLHGQGERLDALSKKDKESLIQDLGTHQIELEMQNEELRRSQADLETSRSRYADLYDFAPIGYFIFDKDGVIREANLTGANLLGIDKRFLIGKMFSLLILPEDRKIFTGHISEVMSKQVLQTCEIKVGKKDRSIFYARIQSIAMEDETGELTLCRSAVSDITKQKQAEEALRASEEKYRSIFEGANDGIIACDLTTGKFLFANERFSALTGYSREEIVKLGVKDIHPEKDLPFVLKEFNEIARGEKTEAREIPVLKKDKRIIYCDIGSAFLNKTILLGFFRDVTDRKKAEEALRESERRERERAAELAALFEAVPTPVFIAHDPDCLHITGNRAADELLRNPRGAEASLSAPAEVKPRHFRALKDGRELRLDELPAQRAARGEMVDDFEFSLAFDDGTIRHVLGYGMPLRDDEGRPRGAVHVLVDITERKKAEEALIQAKEEWERTFASVPDMIAILDNNHRIIRVNKSMAKRFGRKPEECVGMLCYEAVHGTTSPPDFCPHSRTIKDGREHTEEVHEEHLGMDLLVTTTPLFNEKGKMVASVHVAHDITERKKAEKELRQRSEELEAYSYTISHDLRAPLRSIEGFGRALIEDYANKLDATGRDYLLRVTSASQRMKQLIDALLAMSRLTQSEIKEKVVNLSDAINVIAHELNKSQPERAVEFVIAERVFANGDPDMLRIVLENLINNAWKFTSKHPATRIEFGVSRIDDKDVYFVRDDGLGFNMEFADKLFSPFHSVSQRIRIPGPRHRTGNGIQNHK